jgi:hypothetical protein
MNGKGSMKKLKAIFTFIRVLFRLCRHLSGQYFFIRFTIVPEWKRKLSKKRIQLSTNAEKRILHHYSYASRILVGCFYEFYTRKRLNKRDKLILAKMGAITGLIDDLFDIDTVSKSEIHALLNENVLIPNRENESRLILLLRTEILELVPDPQMTKEWADQVLIAQINSLKQKDKETHRNQLKALSDEKGATSLLFYFSGLLPAIDEDLKQLLWQYGVVLQMINDIFDVYKDLQEGVRTYPNTAISISALKNEFLNEYTLRISRLNIGEKPILYAFISLLCGRALVALRQFALLEKITGNRFELHSYTRKQLIVDMGKPVNLWRNMSFTIELIMWE